MVTQMNVRKQVRSLASARRAELWAKRHGGELVRSARERMGLSQGELADQLGVGQAFLSHVEHGRKPLSLAVAAKLALIVSKHRRKFQEAGQ